MKLSEAIRLGAMLKPQGFGYQAIWLDAEASCAFGAALDAVGDRSDSRWLVTVGRYWPALMAPIVEHPVTHQPDSIPSVVWQLNDTHRWTREQIAEWVATIEATQEMPKAECVTVPR